MDGTNKSKICHLYQNSRHQTDTIKTIIQQILEEGENIERHFLFVLTCGELGTNKIHTEIGKFIDSLNNTNFDEIVDNVGSYTDLIPVSD